MYLNLIKYYNKFILIFFNMGDYYDIRLSYLLRLLVSDSIKANIYANIYILK
jgi:hypothetical protein